MAGTFSDFIQGLNGEGIDVTLMSEPIRRGKRKMAKLRYDTVWIDVDEGDAIRVKDLRYLVDAARKAGVKTIAFKAGKNYFSDATHTLELGDE